MTQALTKYQGLSMQSMDEMKSFAAAAYCSGFLGNERDKNSAIAKAIMKIQYGAELGLGPMQSIQGVQVIQGRPTMSAGLIATLVKRSDKYNYRIEEHTDKVCKVVFYENDTKCGESTFTIEDAQRAGLTRNPTWKTYPRNMLFSRALSNGAKWYCADVFAGSVYTPEEMESVGANEGPSRLMSAIDVTGNETPVLEEQEEQEVTI